MNFFINNNNYYMRVSGVKTLLLSTYTIYININVI